MKTQRFDRAELMRALDRTIRQRGMAQLADEIGALKRDIAEGRASPDVRHWEELARLFQCQAGDDAVTDATCAELNGLPAAPGEALAADSGPTEIKKPDILRRLSPRGGDALTPWVWRACYDFHEAGRPPTPGPVMDALRSYIGTPGCPIMGSTAGGLKVEIYKGEQIEVNSEAIRKRIKEWKDACQPQQPEASGG